MGVFHSKGWWPKTSCPPSKVCLPWVSKRGIWDVPGILPGVFKKFVQKNFVRIFRPPELSSLFSSLSSWKATRMQTIGLANHRFRNARLKGGCCLKQRIENHLPPPPREQEKENLQRETQAPSTPTVDTEMLEKVAKPYLP